MRLNNLLLIIFIFIGFSSVFAQKGGSPPTADEEDYYMFPINPGTRGSLSGTMGELRSTHFHTGLDVRTGGVTGLPVHAAAAGDIVRIAVSPTGYGNAVYILHPNGTHTVYAHLDKFHGPIAEHVRKEQYKHKKWDIDLYFPKGKFTVKKGDTIALSGNSGSSGGPHLHFDLRDANHDLLNPLKYNFEEVHDQTPPVVETLAVKTMDKSSRVDGEFGRAEYKVQRIGNNYKIDKPIEVFGNIGLEVYAYDMLDNSRFRTGITEMEVEFDGEIIHRQEISTFSFSDQRNILVHMPYRELQTTRQRFHKLYIDDGNQLNIYNSKLRNGFNITEDNCEYPVKVIMKDTYNNESTLSFTIKCTRPTFLLEENSAVHDNTEEISEDLLENILKISISKEKNKDHKNIKLYNSGIGYELSPDYIRGNEAVYLWDMRKGVPDSADYCGTKKVYDYKASIPSNKEYNHYGEKMAIHFPVNSLFDTLYLKTNYKKENEQEVFEFGNVYQPVRRYLSVTLKPDATYDTRYYAVYSKDAANNLYYQGGTWKDNTVTFGTRDFGTYTISADSTPPSINPVRLAKNDLSFRISDNKSGIKEYNLTINGDWVMMHYDYKRNLIWSEKLNEDQVFEGDLRLVVSDKQGNTETFTRKL